MSAKNLRCTFNLIAVQYSESERLIYVEFGGRLHKIAMQEIGCGSGFVPWLVPGDRVRKIFGDCYFEGLTAFVGRLADNCRRLNVPLPLNKICLDDVRAAVDTSSEALNKLIRELLVAATPGVKQ